MVLTETLIDTGPLVALIDRRDEHHAWAVRQANQLDAPFYTCEGVLGEAHFLLRERTREGNETLIELVERERLDVFFSYADHAGRIHELMRTYADQPMSFADAELVCLSERYRESKVFTTDSDFLVYRRDGDEAIDVLMPS